MVHKNFSIQNNTTVTFPDFVHTKNLLKRMAVFILIIIPFFVLAMPVQTFAGEPLDSLVNRAVKISLKHLAGSVVEVADTTRFPTYGTKELKWKLESAGDWTAGFYPGCLWYAYKLSGDKRFEHWARQWTSSLKGEKENNDTHDLGFKFMCSYDNGLRFSDNIDKGEYKKVLLDAAATLAKRYSPVVKCLSSNWDAKPAKNSYPVIIDIMMNLQLLFWASENGGSAYYADYAKNHAMTTAENFIRHDGGTYHIVRFDKNSGKVINKGTIQGSGDETTWSRGQAWGIYGFLTVFKFTKDVQFLNDAMRLADYFIKHIPAGKIAPWDFQSDIKYRDVSASCIVTSALFELSKYVKTDSLKKYYRSEAEAMLTSLCKAPYFNVNKNTNCLLDHSVQFLPINSNVDVPSIFADYYFLEAIARYRGFD